MCQSLVMTRLASCSSLSLNLGGRKERGGAYIPGQKLRRRRNDVKVTKKKMTKKLTFQLRYFLSSRRHCNFPFYLERDGVV